MHHNADVKTSLSLGFIRPLRRSASNREVVHEIHVIHPAVESTRRARQCRGTTEEKLRREQRSPCLISPREIYERGSTTGFFLRLFPQRIFCAPDSVHSLGFLCGKNPSIGRVSSIRRSTGIHNDEVQIGRSNRALYYEEWIPLRSLL